MVSICIAMTGQTTSLSWSFSYPVCLDSGRGGSQAGRRSSEKQEAMLQARVMCEVNRAICKPNTVLLIQRHACSPDI